MSDWRKNLFGVPNFRDMALEALEEMRNCEGLAGRYGADFTAAGRALQEFESIRSLAQQWGFNDHALTATQQFARELEEARNAAQWFQVESAFAKVAALATEPSYLRFVRATSPRF